MLAHYSYKELVAILKSEFSAYSGTLFLREINSHRIKLLGHETKGKIAMRAFFREINIKSKYFEMIFFMRMQQQRKIICCML